MKKFLYCTAICLSLASFAYAAERVFNKPEVTSSETSAMWEDYTKVTIAKKTGSHMWVRRSGCMVQVDYSGSSTRYRIKDGSSWYNVLECDEYGYSYKFNNNGWWYFNM